MKILVLSCDKNEDLFKPFYHCMEKYWPDHPEIIYSTESTVNPFYKTISHNYDLEHWTDRIRETIQQLDDEYILVMVDDVFLQDYVDNRKIISLINYFGTDTASVNLEPSFDKADEVYQDDILKRSPKGKFKVSVMCGLWSRSKLVELLDYSTNPWQLERDNRYKNFTYLITATGGYLNWGYRIDESHTQWKFGLYCGGRWTIECVKFLIKEGLDKDIDFSKRGIWYQESPYHFIQLAGDCSGMGYLGINRLRGPVDNVVTKGSPCIEALLEDRYYEYVATSTPNVQPRKPSFAGDTETLYDYNVVQIIHNDATDIHYLNELKARCILFKDFYRKVLTENNYYFTINFNMFDLDSNNEELNNNIESIIKTLMEYKILDKVIFVGLKATEKGYGNKRPKNIDHYKKQYGIKYVEIVNNNIRDPFKIELSHKQFLTQFKENISMKKCFGIISYFPWGQPERKQRQDRLERLIKQLSDMWPSIPIMIISQQWKYFTLEGKCKNQVIRFDYGKLGILGARNILRKHFLESEFDYLIMFDDDAIIEKDSTGVLDEYMTELDKHPDGFCFIKGKGSSPYVTYNDSQLNLCAISRDIYEKEPLPNIDPQKSEGFEDRIWSTLLHFKYADKEFDAPAGIRCVHFKNVDEIVPSTWAAQQVYNWNQIRSNTKEIEKYIAEHKELPDKWKR